jgi:hypothetical protein
MTRLTRASVSRLAPRLDIAAGALSSNATEPEKLGEIEATLKDVVRVV